MHQMVLLLAITFVGFALTTVPPAVAAQSGGAAARRPDSTGNQGGEYS